MDVNQPIAEPMTFQVKEQLREGFNQYNRVALTTNVVLGSFLSFLRMIRT